MMEQMAGGDGEEDVQIETLPDGSTRRVVTRRVVRTAVVQGEGVVEQASGGESGMVIQQSSSSYTTGGGDGQTTVAVQQVSEGGEGGGEVTMTTKQVLASADVILPQMMTHQLKMSKVQSKVAYDQGREVLKTHTMDKVMSQTPGVVLARENAILTSQIEYAKEAQKVAASIQGLPVDSVPFPAAKNAMEIASDLHYKQDITGEYKGFQTMDPEGHPVIVKGKKAAEIISDIPYRQEYHDEKALIYFPQHITEGYESMNKAATFRTTYKNQYESEKEKNSFK